jgi:hypothetical protein
VAAVAVAVAVAVVPAVGAPPRIVLADGKEEQRWVLATSTTQARDTAGA